MTSLAREHQRQIEGSSEKTAIARNTQILQFSPHSTTIKTMMLNKREISHPQAINRSWFCRESFKQSQSVSWAAFAVSEEKKKTRVFCSQSKRIKCMLEWMRILTCQTYVSSVFRVFVLEATSQSFTVQSADPDASNAPSQLKQQQDILTKSIFHEII